MGGHLRLGTAVDDDGLGPHALDGARDVDGLYKPVAEGIASLLGPGPHEVMGFSFGGMTAGFQSGGLARFLEAAERLQRLVEPVDPAENRKHIGALAAALEPFGQTIGIVPSTGAAATVSAISALRTEGISVKSLQEHHDIENR